MHRKTPQQMGLRLRLAAEYIKFKSAGRCWESNRNADGLDISSSNTCPSHRAHTPPPVMHHGLFPHGGPPTRSPYLPNTRAFLGSCTQMSKIFQLMANLTHAGRMSRFPGLGKREFSQLSPKDQGLTTGFVQGSNPSRPQRTESQGYNGSHDSFFQCFQRLKCERVSMCTWVTICGCECGVCTCVV